MYGETQLMQKVYLHSYIEKKSTTTINYILPTLNLNELSCILTT